MPTITIDQNGNTEFTRSPDALKLFADQPKSIIRMSDIKFCEENQKHYIEFLTGPMKGGVLKEVQVLEYMAWTGHPVSQRRYESMFLLSGNPALKPAYFDTYELAVRMEVDFIDWVRLGGFSFT